MHSQYRTPKRRHSSLFHRMQEQIQKISRKLSAAKQSARLSSYDRVKPVKGKRQITGKPTDAKQRFSQGKQRVKPNLFQTSNFKNVRKNIHFDEFPQNSIIQTVRIKNIPERSAQQQNSPLSGKKTFTSKTLNRRLNFVSMRQNQQDKIFKLQQQNEELSLQIKNLELVCSDQSYRLGFASAYFEDKCKKLQEQKEQYQKENIYLQKLCEHYKSKAKKYKQNLKRYSNKKGSQSSCEFFS